MSSQIAAVRSHRAVVAAVVGAAIALTVCALVAIAVMLGWLPAKTTFSTPASSASPGQQVAGTAPGVELLPGETLVSPAEGAPAPAHSPDGQSPSPALAKPGPVTPTYAPPAPRKPSPAPPAAAAAPLRPSPAPPPASNRQSAAPPPRYAQSPPPERAAAPRTRAGICINCAVVSSIRSRAEDWEVRVRFDDGTSKTIRYPTQPAFRPGQRVYLEGGRLIAE
ncbi:MAG TPA: hypothetical protein VN878_01815 [Usitatibacter sp.]|nr:hypothetical protein [Usitatibacter sp.]